MSSQGTTNDMALHRQWASRPADQRCTSIFELGARVKAERQATRRKDLANRDLSFVPSATDPYSIGVTGPNGVVATPTHWSMGQLCSLAGVPADYMRGTNGTNRAPLPGALIADCLNYGLHVQRNVTDLSVAIRRKVGDTDPDLSLIAANGPRYTPIWNTDIVDEIIGNFDLSKWTVPGIFGRPLDKITTQDTTLYLSSQDMWIFLANEQDRIELPGYRQTERTTGDNTLARGFFVANSEVGASRFVLGMWAFLYACCNRILWGVGEYEEIAFRHTPGATHKWIEEVKPVLAELSSASAKPISDTIAAARSKKIDQDVERFLSNRFGYSKGVITSMQAVHMLEEQRPMETLWDAAMGITAYARQLEHANVRTGYERDAGKLIQLAA
jgi:hypothetical protein